MGDDSAVHEASEEGRASAEGAESGVGGDDCSVSGDGEAVPAGVAVGLGASPDITLAERDSKWAGKLVLVPAEMWPDFACNEHGGMGCAAARPHPTIPSH
jgi:hypothetical protein